MSNPAKRSSKITLLQDTRTIYPELWMDVYVTGTPMEKAQFAEMFVRGRCSLAKTPETADLVVFAGGADVDPSLYGNPPKHPRTFSDPARDRSDKALYERCKKQGIPMVGICRGAQFLHVMNGGVLYQHMDGHNSSHAVFETISRTRIGNVSSVHHQACKENEEMEVLAKSFRVATNRYLNDKKEEDPNATEVEAFFYEKTGCLGFQGHPEYKNYGEYTAWCLTAIWKYFNENPSYCNVNRVLRLKEVPSVLKAFEEQEKAAKKAADKLSTEADKQK